MNQKKLSSASGVLLAICTATMCICVSAANPVPQVTPSIQPEITPPTITINTPKNNAVIHTNTLNIQFTVTAPTSKDAYTSAISKIYCLPSWVADKAIPNHYVYLATGDEHLQLKEINLTLTDVPAGQHRIEIGAAGSVTVSEGTYSFQHSSDSTATVYFTISDSATNTQEGEQNTAQPTFQATFIQIATIAIAIVSATTIAAALLIYKKHQKGTGYLLTSYMQSERSICLILEEKAC